jgi:hypothetical protein
LAAPSNTSAAHVTTTAPHPPSEGPQAGDITGEDHNNGNDQVEDGTAADAGNITTLNADSEFQNGNSDTTTLHTSGSARAKKPFQARKPIAELFTPWSDNEPEPTPPARDPSWGTIPYATNWEIRQVAVDEETTIPQGVPKDGSDYVEPQFSTGGPPARSTNAQTNPPLWEDRKWEFREGRYHKAWVAKGAQEPTDPNLPDLDQNDNLTLRLMDMRPRASNDRRPKRQPVVYRYANGKPKDWHNRQTIKALNDRRREAIWRITLDTPWTDVEREYLVELCEEFPDASILEYAQRFNFRFVGDYKEAAGMMRFHHIQAGRTLESVRNEYITYKEWYTASPPQVPDPIRQEADKTDYVKKGNARVRTEGEIRMNRFKGIYGDVKLGLMTKSEYDEYQKVYKEILARNEQVDEELLELAGEGHEDDIRDSAVNTPEHPGIEDAAPEGSTRSDLVDAVESDGKAEGKDAETLPANGTESSEGEKGAESNTASQPNSISQNEKNEEERRSTAPTKDGSSKEVTPDTSASDPPTDAPTPQAPSNKKRPRTEDDDTDANTDTNSPRATKRPKKTPVSAASSKRTTARRSVSPKRRASR